MGGRNSATARVGTGRKPETAARAELEPRNSGNFNCQAESVFSDKSLQYVKIFYLCSLNTFNNFI